MSDHTMALVLCIIWFLLAIPTWFYWVIRPRWERRARDWMDLYSRHKKYSDEQIAALKNLLDESRQISLDILKHYDPQEHERACQALACLYTSNLMKRNGS